METTREDGAHAAAAAAAGHDTAVDAAVASAQAATDAALMVGSLDKYEDAAFGAELSVAVAPQRKRGLEADGGAGEYEEEEEEGASHNAEYLAREGKMARAAKRARRHNWQPKYETEFGLLAIERDAVSGDVTLAMCGFCKAFGREGKYEQLVQADAEAGHESKKRRRRSLTTTKFFRAFRVDNIRSHLQGAHPRRWAEYEMLPKQDAVRARYLQMQGDFQHYDNLGMVDDVVLGSSALNADSDMAYVHAQAQALAHSTLADHQQQQQQQHQQQHQQQQQQAATATQVAAVHSGATAVAALAAVPAPLNSSHAATAPLPAMPLAQTYSGPRTAFDYEKHLTEQLALDRERLEFEKAKFKKEVELKERELELLQKRMDQEALLHDKRVEASRESAEAESTKFFRLAEMLRESITSTQATSGGASVV